MVPPQTSMRLLLRKRPITFDGWIWRRQQSCQFYRRSSSAQWSYCNHYYFNRLAELCVIVPRIGVQHEWPSVFTTNMHSALNRVRTASTAIRFVLDWNDFSAFHRLRSDETWHFYAGGTF